MKKLSFVLSMVLLSMSFTSCFNVKVASGDITTRTPVVKVNSEWNHHFLYGLIATKNAKMEAQSYVEDSKNYVVKTNMTFANGFVSFLTFGLYTPTTTTYYVPLKDIKE